MKQQINPAVVAVVVIVLLVVVGFVLMKGGGGGGSLPVGSKDPANASPFGPGGKANAEFGESKKK